MIQDLSPTGRSRVRRCGRGPALHPPYTTTVPIGRSSADRGAPYCGVYLRTDVVTFLPAAAAGLFRRTSGGDLSGSIAPVDARLGRFAARREQRRPTQRLLVGKVIGELEDIADSIPTLQGRPARE